MKSDHFIYKAAQFCKGRIINKIKNLVYCVRNMFLKMFHF